MATNTNLCVKTSNNKYQDSPALMADGRTFTDYRPNCNVNGLLRNSSNSFNSHDYRLFLTRNAQNLIDLNRNLAFEKHRVGPCMLPYNVGTMLPEKTKVNCDRHGCTVQVNDDTGIGQGRQYNSFPDSFYPVNLGNNSLVNCSSTPLGKVEQQSLDKIQNNLIELEVSNVSQ